MLGNRIFPREESRTADHFVNRALDAIELGEFADAIEHLGTAAVLYEKFKMPVQAKRCRNKMHPYRADIYIIPRG